MKPFQLPTSLARGALALGLALSLLAAGPVTANIASADGGAGACAATYVVKTGDTLSAVGFSYNVPWPSLAQANGLVSPYTLYPGQSLCIPAGVAPANTTPATATRVRFLTGATAASAAYVLPAGQTQYYVLNARQGQPMLVDVTSFNGDVTFSLTTPSGAALVSASDKRATWQGQLPASGDYLLALYGGASAENISLSLTIAARLAFAPGADHLALSGQTAGGYAVSYAAWARQGQVLNVNVASAGPNAVLTVWGFSDGQPYLRDVVEQTSFTLTLPASQDYMILVVPRAGMVVNYALTVTIR